MAGIWNINGIYDLNTKKITSKLSFDIGEMFLARIVNMDSKNSEILLKLLDGWQFPAKLEEPVLNVPDGLVKFQVVGLDDGKLKLVMIPKKDDSTAVKDSIGDTLDSLGLADDAELHDMLQSMVKHNIPLTRENISKIKTVIDFRDKINNSPDEADKFIEKYIVSKGIDQGSLKAAEIRGNLKSFFESIKDVDTDSILTLMDNGIELTEDNIESFKKIFKEDSVIYKDIKDVAAKLKNAAGEGELQTFRESVMDIAEKQNTVKNDADSSSPIISGGTKDFDTLYKHLKTMPESDHEVKTLEIDDNNADDNAKVKDNGVTLKQEERTENLKPDKLGNKLKPDLSRENGKADEVQNSSKSEAVKVKTETLAKKTAENIKDTWPQVKEELSAKTEELKTMIKEIMDTKDKIKPEIFSKVFEAVKENINDFKVFNALSNQYYYMDVPVRVNDNEYGCRLLVKDERKKDKKIDSRNIKIAASVKTINMGTVNAFIKVSGTNMNVDIKCDDSFIGFIDGEKTRLYDELASMGYKPYINVSKKEEDVDISGCSSFFDEMEPASLDTRV